MSMYIAVSHYSEKIYICNNKDTNNIDEIVSFDPRTYDKILSLYLTKKKKIYDINRAKENYEKTKNLNNNFISYSFFLRVHEEVLFVRFFLQLLATTQFSFYFFHSLFQIHCYFRYYCYSH